MKSMFGTSIVGIALLMVGCAGAQHKSAIEPARLAMEDEARAIVAHSDSYEGDFISANGQVLCSLNKLPPCDDGPGSGHYEPHTFLGKVSNQYLWQGQGSDPDEIAWEETELLENNLMAIVYTDKEIGLIYLHRDTLQWREVDGYVMKLADIDDFHFSEHYPYGGAYQLVYIQAGDTFWKLKNQKGVGYDSYAKEAHDFLLEQLGEPSPAGWKEYTHQTRRDRF